MSYFFLFVGIVLAVAVLGWSLVRANPASLAATLRLAGPMALGAIGLFLTLAGRIQFAGILFAAAGALYVSSKRKQAAKISPGRRSTVRSAALEMELDHDTGGLEGVVLAGSCEGRTLASLDMPALIGLVGEFAADAESIQLLETYLDGRFPAWREHVDADVGAGQGGAPGTGAMTEKEAYQILGLEAGASTADIRKAHRRLMQRVHPDLGGSSFLASRINQAKDFLLSMHG